MVNLLVSAARVFEGLRNTYLLNGFYAIYMQRYLDLKQALSEL